MAGLCFPPARQYRPLVLNFIRGPLHGAKAADICGGPHQTTLPTAYVCPGFGAIGYYKLNLEGDYHWVDAPTFEIPLRQRLALHDRRS